MGVRVLLAPEGWSGGPGGSWGRQLCHVLPSPLGPLLHLCEMETSAEQASLGAGRSKWDHAKPLSQW